MSLDGSPTGRVFKMKETHPFLCAAVTILLVCVVSANVAAQAGQNPQKISAKKLTQLMETIRPAVHYGGVMIPAGDTLRGPVIAVDGALDIQDGGVLAGDAWIVNGRLILTGGAVVSGSIHLVNSEAFRSRLSVVTGSVSHYTCECGIVAEKLEGEGELVFKKMEDPLAIKTKLSFSPGRPTRVRYDVLRLGLTRRNPRHPAPHVHGHALIDVPLWLDTRGYLGFDVDATVPLDGERISLLARGFKKVHTNDDWQISRGENTWMLVLTGIEYLDYYERRGFELGLELRAYEYMRVQALATYGRDVSMVTGDAPSVFKSNQRLRDNPAIDDGDRLTVSGVLRYDSREDPARAQNAWFVRLWVEKGLADGLGEFSYTAFSFDLHRYTRLPFKLQWDVRGKLFSAFDRIPRQVYRSLNGYGGVRGLNDSPFAVRRGDRLALFSMELRRPLPELPVFRILFSQWDVVVFSDVGQLIKTEDERSPLRFLEESFEHWGKTAGIGISGESFLPYVGLYVAKDLDGGRESPRVILRINRSF